MRAPRASGRASARFDRLIGGTVALELPGTGPDRACAHIVPATKRAARIVLSAPFLSPLFGAFGCASQQSRQKSRRPHSFRGYGGHCVWTLKPPTPPRPAARGRVVQRRINFGYLQTSEINVRAGGPGAPAPGCGKEKVNRKGGGGKKVRGRDRKRTAYHLRPARRK